jgi:alpha-N-acetylglucosamine transferase
MLLSMLSRRRTWKFLGLSGILCTTVFFIGQIIRTSPAYLVSSISHSHQKYAYATFLGPSTPFFTKPDPPPDQEDYFNAARLLTFQILHSNRTRTRIHPSAPFLILTLPSVPDSWLSTLTSEGATIVPVVPLDLPPESGNWLQKSRFRDVLSKLRLWQLTDYDKILFLDADTILLHPLDSIFTDPELSMPMPVIRNNSTDDRSEASLPSSYLLSASADTWGNQTLWFDHQEYLCACFMLLTPSEHMFKYYQWLLSQAGTLFDLSLPEQNLLFYAHRADGNMPWKRIPIEWSANDAEIMHRLDGRLKSLHIKSWDGAEGTNLADQKVKSLWGSLMREMESYHSTNRG